MSLPSSHKAAVVPEAGAQHQVVDRSLAPIGDDEVAVKVIATSINPVDWKMRDYRVFLSEYPAVLGSDASGEVVSAGKSVTNVAVGDRVFFQGIIGNYDSSTFQQYVKMPAALLAKTPKKVSDEQAATFWVAGMVVATGFYHKSGMSLSPPWNADGASVGKGKTAVILGGSSSVGQYAIQFAKLSGFDHIVTSSSASHFDFLKSLGATTVLDRSEATTAEAFVKAIPSDSSVDFVYDTISSPSTQLLGVQILQALKGGKVLVVMPADEKAVKQSEEKDLPDTSVVAILGIGSHPEYRYISEPLAAHLGGENGYVAKGDVTLNRPMVIEGGLNAVEKALKANKDGVSGVKVIIRPNEA
ncbi:alcohol dehydrogenase [Moesziomyces antarcticus]|uniref:Related to Zinc-binding oxidoreductase n=1 Tax=Pseudozyma antarctica TaxID=84753 RepID=A0A5C3FFJ8_PSEA2|nr:alcohol dehydrogenase [Moesziomyces antarcticus]GAK61945.1 alcohol dehydrogenase [Moesziomyces antarcticus]SPO42465.1 related to Zinc-binding oxidoreductase [Moesziomyces antarcticus]